MINWNMVHDAAARFFTLQDSLATELIEAGVKQSRAWDVTRSICLGILTRTPEEPIDDDAIAEAVRQGVQSAQEAKAMEPKVEWCPGKLSIAGHDQSCTLRIETDDKGQQTITELRMWVGKDLASTPMNVHIPR